jgi:GNAT superfamily N-acetyltransferase
VHPAGELISRAFAGEFPVAGGAWTREQPWRPGLGAVIALTGHARLALPDGVDEEVLTTHPPDGFGGVHDPRLIAGLAGPDAWIDSLDLVLARHSDGGRSRLVARPDLADHPRVQHARQVRNVLHVLGSADASDRSVGIIAQGLGGLTELSFELDPACRGRGQGRAWVTELVAATDPAEVVISSVAPGNTASLQVLLRNGFRPVGSVQLFRGADQP